MKIITVTGSVGTGKTLLSKKLAKKLNYIYLDVNRLIEKNKLSSGYDIKRKCYIIDIKKLNKSLINKINQRKDKKIKGIIIDSHLSYRLPKKYVNLCIVTKCDLKELQRRLKNKRYSKEKIRENLDCEIFDICLNEAKEAGHVVFIVDTTKGINIKYVLKKLSGFNVV